MINPTRGVVYNQTPVVQITEEVIPSEGSFVHQDGRLYNLGEISPGSKVSLSQNGPARTRLGFDRPLGNPTQTTEAVFMGSAGTYESVDPTAELSARDAKIIEKHLPDGFDDTGISAVPENITYTQVASNPQLLVNGQPGIESIERRLAETRIAETPIVDPVLANAAMNRTTNQLQRSRIELNQSELNNMRYQNHQTFENWEVNRNVFVTDRLNIMDDLLAGMERKLDWLETLTQKTTLFFKEREAQEHEYARKVRHSLPQLGEHLESINQPNAMFDFTRGMKESDAFHAMETRNSEIMAMFIKKDVLDWILIPSEKAYKNQSTALRTPLYAHRRRLEHLANQRSRAYNKYFKLYDKIQRNPEQSKNESKIFKRQMKYSLAAREELDYLKLYSEQGLVVINEFTNLAISRINEIQRAFSLYLQKYTELHQNTVTPPEPILNLIESSNGIDGMRNLFTPAALMSLPNQDFLRVKLNKSELTYADLEGYLVYFPESVDPARSSFVVREWEAVKEGNIFKRPRPCTIIATTANNLLIVEKKLDDQETDRVENPMQLRYTKVMGVEAGQGGVGTSINIVERTPGTLFNHSHKARLRFETQDQASSFLTYVNTQTAQLNGEVNPLLNQTGMMNAGIPMNSNMVYAGGVPITSVSQVSPIMYQNNLAGSQLSPITPINAQSVITRQCIPDQSNIIVSQLATPVRSQQVLSSGQYTPVDQSGFLMSQPEQVVFQNGMISGQNLPVNQVVQTTGEL